ncbi:MAG: holdfast attachemtn complex surface anchor HfaD [Oceanicaulis sp. HLUCCA04]|nr:MAG: holdfast attachemtn complex surface anchor HfaD [Oceanicaulis sp. HLUCCA04]
MTAAIATSAASFAVSIDKVENDQSNDAPVDASVEVDAVTTDVATAVATAQSNSAGGSFATPAEVTSSQSTTGTTSATTDIEADSVWGLSTGFATAQGNALTADAADGLEMDAEQTAGAGASVSALSALRLNTYGGNTAQSATASANAIEVMGTGDMPLETSQTSEADVDARSDIEAEEVETALATAQSAGNSLTVTGLEANIIALADQDNGGTVRSTVDADIANANWGVTAMSEASGNTASIQNESGYGHLQGSQNNRGEVRATTTLAVGTFGDGPVTGSSHAVGNNALVSNIGADAYSGVSQNNSGAVTGQVSMQLGSGMAAYATSSAIGNAQSAYICATCPVGLEAPVNQVNSGAINSITQMRANGHVGGMTGAATAVGNVSTFSTIGGGN